MTKKKVIKEIENKKIYSFEGSVPEFTEEQLRKQVKKQVKFLKTLYPFLEEDEWHDGGIELRPIKRSSELKYIRSFNAWRLNENDINELFDFINKGINGRPFCLYYSSYTFDSSIGVAKKQKDKINNENALFTTILAMDFDNIDYPKFKRYKDILLNLGIETIDIYSGHGVQSIVLLDKKIYDASILKRWTNLLLRKGFPIDSALVDPARVLRMPYSFNCKEFDKNNKYYKENAAAIATTDIAWTEKRYNVVDVFRKIQTLEDVIPVLEEDIKDGNTLDIKQEPLSVKAKVEEKEDKKKQILEVKNMKIEEVKKAYFMLPNVDKLPESLIKMLYKTPGGIRNSTMLFLIPFLKNSLGLTIERIKEVMTVWGHKCLPSYDASFIRKEVDRLLDYNYKGKYGLYTEEMCKVFGYFEFTTFTRENKVKIPNSIFEDMNVISDGAFKIYLTLILDKSNNGQKNYNQEDICRLAKIDRATFYRNIKDLTSMGYITKVKSIIAKRKGEEYIYYLNPYTSAREGFTLIEKATVKLMLIELTDGEIKLYSYLCKMLNSENKIFAGQKYLAEKIGKSQNRVSEITDYLHQKDYLNKTTDKIQNVLHCTYNLNY